MRNSWFVFVYGGFLLLCGCGGGAPAPPPTPSFLSVAPASLSFGVSVVGTTSGPQVETLTNLGGTELAISGVTITGTNTADFEQNNTCGSSLGYGASCTLNVTFTPSQLGQRSASITITDNAAVSSQVLSLTGVGGAAGPNATLTPTSLAFASHVYSSLGAGSRSGEPRQRRHHQLRDAGARRVGRSGEQCVSRDRSTSFR